MESTISRIAIYARVSTADQNIDMQLTKLREYAAHRGWAVFGEYCDVGVSGAKASRPQLNRMIQDAHRRRFDAIVVWKLDRLGRSLKHLVTTIEDMAAYGVIFVALRDNLDLSTPTGRLRMHVIGAMVEFERDFIKERVSAGVAAARKRGVRLGRPHTYVSADKVKALRDTGMPWRQVAKKLKVGTGTAVRAFQQVTS